MKDIEGKICPFENFMMFSENSFSKPNQEVLARVERVKCSIAKKGNLDHLEFSTKKLPESVVRQASSNQIYCLLEFLGQI